MPWVIKEDGENLFKDCVLVATMDGPDMLRVSIHIASEAKKDKND